MAAKPGVLCHLKKGKAFGSFNGFVETWNWMVDFIANLRGDESHIKVDRTNESCPRITYIKPEEEEEPSTGGGFVGIGAFAYNKATWTVSGGAFCLGRNYYFCNGATVGSGMVYLVIDYSNNSAIVSNSPNQQTYNHSNVPLYRIGARGDIEADYRGAPVVPMWE